MASLPNYVPKQEMPPPGGFGQLNYKASYPKSRGPPGWAIFSFIGLMTAYGFYQVGQTNIQRRLLKKEKREMRIAILPFLQAEEDVLFLKKQSEMGWKQGPSVMHMNRWAAPR